MTPGDGRICIEPQTDIQIITGNQTEIDELKIKLKEKEKVIENLTDLVNRTVKTFDDDDLSLNIFDDQLKNKKKDWNLGASTDEVIY